MTTKRVYFPKVKEAREALKEKALALYEQYDNAIKEALAAQEFEVALDAMQWLMEHMPADEDGVTVIDHSVDKPKQVEVGGGPTIQIGFKLGGIDAMKGLPSQVIDVEPEKDE